MVAGLHLYVWHIGLSLTVHHIFIEFDVTEKSMTQEVLNSLNILSFSNAYLDVCIDRGQGRKDRKRKGEGERDGVG